jgi:hypothetical protein
MLRRVQMTTFMFAARSSRRGFLFSIRMVLPEATVSSGASLSNM